MKIIKASLFIGIILVITGALACQQAAEKTEIEQPIQPARDGVLVHISHGADDPHRVLMGLQMASIMAEDHDVLVYFDIKGVEVVYKDSKDLAYTQFESSHTQLKDLLDLGVPVLACPGCLKAAGKSLTDLMPGVQIADKELFFTFTNGRIITIDY
jgi:predicted peroxiredoxin